MLFFILIGGGAVNDATLFLLLFILFLTRHMTKCFILGKNSKTTEITCMQLCHALVLRSVHHLALKQSSPGEVYFLESSVNFLLFKLHPL